MKDKMYVITETVKEMLTEKRINEAILKTIIAHEDLFDKYVDLLLPEINMDGGDGFDDLDDKAVKELAKRVIENK